MILVYDNYNKRSNCGFCVGTRFRARREFNFSVMFPFFRLLKKSASEIKLINHWQLGTHPAETNTPVIHNLLHSHQQQTVGVRGYTYGNPEVTWSIEDTCCFVRRSSLKGDPNSYLLILVHVGAILSPSLLQFMFIYLLF